MKGRQTTRTFWAIVVPLFVAALEIGLWDLLPVDEQQWAHTIMAVMLWPAYCYTDILGSIFDGVGLQWGAYIVSVLWLPALALRSFLRLTAKKQPAGTARDLPIGLRSRHWVAMTYLLIMVPWTLWCFYFTGERAPILNSIRWLLLFPVGWLAVYAQLAWAILLGLGESTALDISVFTSAGIVFNAWVWGAMIGHFLKAKQWMNYSLGDVPVNHEPGRATPR